MIKLPTGMNWYLAKIIYQIVCEGNGHKSQFDEQFRLIRADESAWAWEKAMIIGRREECSFLNDRHETVLWKFIAVEEVCRIDDIDDGMQLYSQTWEPQQAEEYISLVRARAQRRSAGMEPAWATDN